MIHYCDSRRHCKMIWHQQRYREQQNRLWDLQGTGTTGPSLQWRRHVSPSKSHGKMVPSRQCNLIGVLCHHRRMTSPAHCVAVQIQEKTAVFLRRRRCLKPTLDLVIHCCFRVRLPLGRLSTRNHFRYAAVQLTTLTRRWENRGQWQWTMSRILRLTWRT